MNFMDMITNAVAGAGPLAGGLKEFVDDQGGVNAIAQKFEEKGYGQELHTWLGQGTNQMISAQVIKMVFGEERLAGITSKFGMSPDQFAEMLAKYLPLLLDRLSPKGKLPSTSEEQGEEKAAGFDLQDLFSKLIKH